MSRNIRTGKCLVTDKVALIDLQNSLTSAAKNLRHAWRIAKHNDMEGTAKELADTVLDVETAAEQVSDTLGMQSIRSTHVIQVSWCQCCGRRVPDGHVCPCESAPRTGANP